MTEKMVYTSGMDVFIRKHYKQVAGELAKAFNLEFGTSLTGQQLHGARKARGLKTGRTGFFTKGKEPWNKGLHYHNPGSVATQFKLGSVPPNKVEMWSERIDRDGYIQMKVPEKDPYTGSATRIKLKHIWLWEQKNGSVPEKHAVVFVDGDKLNCVIENLELISRNELLQRNKLGLKSFSPELQPTIKAVAKLQVSTFEKLKRQA